MMQWKGAGGRGRDQYDFDHQTHLEVLFSHKPCMWPELVGILVSVSLQTSGTLTLKYNQKNSEFDSLSIKLFRLLLICCKLREVMLRCCKWIPWYVPVPITPSKSHDKCIMNPDSEPSSQKGKFLTKQQAVRFNPY